MHEQVLKPQRPPEWHRPNREQRPHDDRTMVFADPQTSGKHFCSPLSTASHSQGQMLLCFKKSYFVTHSNDQYQLAEFLNTFQAGCSACRHSAPDLKPFLQEGKIQISTATFSMLIEVALWRKTLFAWKLQANGSVHNMQRCFKILWGCFPLIVCQLLSQGRNSVIQLLR